MRGRYKRNRMSLKLMMELGMKPIDIMVVFAYQSTISIFLCIFHVAISKSAMGFSMISQGFEEINEENFNEI